jgi:hypothetical protein
MLTGQEFSSIIDPGDLCHTLDIKGDNRRKVEQVVRFQSHALRSWIYIMGLAFSGISFSAGFGRIPMPERLAVVALAVTIARAVAVTVATAGGLAVVVAD